MVLTQTGLHPGGGIGAVLVNGVAWTNLFVVFLAGTEPSTEHGQTSLSVAPKAHVWIRQPDRRHAMPFVSTPRGPPHCVRTSGYLLRI